VNQWLNPLKVATGSNLVDAGRAAAHADCVGVGIPHFIGGPHPHSLRHGFAVANLRRWAAGGADLSVMLPYLACYMGHADLRGTQYYLRLTADAYPEVMAKAQVRFGYVIPRPA
jgi:integrase/recombinase XerD